MYYILPQNIVFNQYSLRNIELGGKFNTGFAVKLHIYKLVYFIECNEAVFFQGENVCLKDKKALDVSI